MIKDRFTGKIKYWNGRKGFGFIQPDHDDKQVFVHIRAFTYRKYRPTVGQAVSYVIATDKQGRTRAEDVLVDDEINQASQEKKKQLSKLAMPLFLGLSVVVFAFMVWWLTRS